MARRSRPMARRPPHNVAGKGQHIPRKRMLDLGREGHLKYDLKQVLERTDLDESQVRSFTQTLLAKGSRGSTEDVKAFVENKREEGMLPSQAASELERVLDRYSTWR